MNFQYARGSFLLAIFFILHCSCSKQTLMPSPKGHRPIQENHSTRVMEVILPPGAKVPLHNHDLPAVIIVHQTSRSIVRNSAGEIVSDATVPKGAYWTPAHGPHYSIENAGKQTMYLYRVDIK